jgi:hypothetical protein
MINQQMEVATLLIEAGADTEIRGRGAPGFYGKTVRDLAVETGMDDLVAVLDRARSEQRTDRDGPNR